MHWDCRSRSPPAHTKGVHWNCQGDRISLLTLACMHIQEPTSLLVQDTTSLLNQDSTLLLTHACVHIQDPSSLLIQDPIPLLNARIHAHPRPYFVAHSRSHFVADARVHAHTKILTPTAPCPPKLVSSKGCVVVPGPQHISAEELHHHLLQEDALPPVTSAKSFLRVVVSGRQWNALPACRVQGS